jgi:parallel beta-helix repeat protein/predicted outer membrane repeat protein
MGERTNLKIRLAILIFLVVLGNGAPTKGKIIYVKADTTVSKNNSGANFQADIQYPSIQEAINAAVDGDTIILAPGTFHGDGNRDIDFKGKAITIRSMDPNDPNVVAATIIDCQGSEAESHRGFYFHSGEDENSVVEGLIITKGFHGRGAGILCIGSSPIIRNNIITDNEIEFDADGGAGIGCWRGASPTITNNIISNNTCAPGGGGGGIRCYEAGSPTITNNTISGNTASQGGGVCIDFCSPTISDCTFSDNSATGMGGGVLTDSNMILTNCNFIENSARTGAGIYNYHCNPVVLNCFFSGNSCEYDGGAIFNTSDSSPVLKNCVFTANSSGNAGGAIYNHGYSGPKGLILTNCTFTENKSTSGGGLFGAGTLMGCTFLRNTAQWGGGAYGGGSLSNCMFIDNVVEKHGGGMVFDGSLLNQCTFVGNTAGRNGGGIWNWDNSPTHVNCRFSGNVAGRNGGAMWNVDGGGYTLINCTLDDNIAGEQGGAIHSDDWPILASCILWGNRDSSGVGESAHVYAYYGSPAVNYCCIQGWTGALGGLGNIGADPCFVSLGYWADANESSTIVEPNDPNAVWVDGDYHLKSQAGRWNPNTASWIQDVTTSPCIDTGDMKSPIGHEPFPNGGLINMGTYGGTVEASKSYFGESICEMVIAGDINGDCKVDFKDFAIQAFHWLEER